MNVNTVSVPASGEIWLSKRFFSQDGYSYEVEPQLLLMLWEQSAVPGHLACLPLTTDSWNATEIDLLLAPSEHTLHVPLRAVCAWQGTVAPAQLARYLGQLQDPALLALLEANALPEHYWGTPLEGPDDPRLAARDRFARPLQTLYGFSWRLLAD